MDQPPPLVPLQDQSPLRQHQLSPPATASPLHATISPHNATAAVSPLHATISPHNPATPTNQAATSAHVTATTLSNQMEFERLLYFDTSPLHNPGLYPQLLAANELPPSTSIVLMDRNHQLDNIDRPPIFEVRNRTAEPSLMKTATSRAVRKPTIRTTPVASAATVAQVVNGASAPVAAAATAVTATAQTEQQQAALQAYFRTQQQMMLQAQVHQIMAQQKADEVKKEKEEKLAAHQRAFALNQHHSATMAQAVQTAAAARNAAEALNANAAASVAASSTSATSASSSSTVATPAARPSTYINVPASSVCHIRHREYREKMRHAVADIATNVMHIEVDQFAGFSVMSGKQLWDCSSPLDSEEDEIDERDELDVLPPTETDRTKQPLRVVLLNMLDEHFLRPPSPLPPEPIELDEWAYEQQFIKQEPVATGTSSATAARPPTSTTKKKRPRDDSDSDGWNEALGLKFSSDDDAGEDYQDNGVGPESEDSDYSHKKHAVGRGRGRGRPPGTGRGGKRGRPPGRGRGRAAAQMGRPKLGLVPVSGGPYAFAPTNMYAPNPYAATASIAATDSTLQQQLVAVASATAPMEVASVTITHPLPMQSQPQQTQQQLQQTNPNPLNPAMLAAYQRYQQEQQQQQQLLQQHRAAALAAAANASTHSPPTSTARRGRGRPRGSGRGGRGGATKPPRRVDSESDSDGDAQDEEWQNDWPSSGGEDDDDGDDHSEHQHQDEKSQPRPTLTQLHATQPPPSTTR